MDQDQKKTGKMNRERFTDLLNTMHALSRVARLQPVGRQGATVYPSTSLKNGVATYTDVEEYIPEFGESVKCVVLNTEGAEANRFEARLLELVMDEEIDLPFIQVVDENDNPICTSDGSWLCTLTTPHRLADVYIRETEKDGQNLFDQPKYAQWEKAKNLDMTSILGLCPSSILFGVWGSTRGPGNGLKMARVLMSEILAINATINKRGGGAKGDPLVQGMPDKIRIDKKTGMMVTKGGEEIAPSERNWGLIPPHVRLGGVSCHWIEQRLIISLPRLKMMRFPLNGKENKDVTRACRAVIASLGVMAATIDADEPIGLRSGCDLIYTSGLEWKFERVGQEPVTFTLSRQEAIDLFKECVAHAVSLKVDWSKEPTTVKQTPAIKEWIKKCYDEQANRGFGKKEKAARKQKKADQDQPEQEVENETPDEE